MSRYSTKKPSRRFDFRFISPVTAVLIGLVIIGLCAGAILLLPQLLGGLSITTRTAYAAETIVKELRSVSELTTAIRSIETIVTTLQGCDLKGTGISLGTAKLLYVAYGEVKGGINVEELKTEDITVSGDKVTVRLPPPKITDSKIDVTRSYVYDFQDTRSFLTGLACPDWTNSAELQTWAERKALPKVEFAACDGGLLTDANRQAEVAFSALLRALGFNTIEIKTQNPPPCPPEPAP